MTSDLSDLSAKSWLKPRKTENHMANAPSPETRCGVQMCPETALQVPDKDEGMSVMKYPRPLGKISAHGYIGKLEKRESHPMQL
jgi:hypothetical protein